MTDCVWWMFLFWLPSFFQDSQSLDQHLDLKSIGLPFIIIYLVSDVGSIFYGWLATRFIENGWSVNKARKMTMFICVVTVIPIFFDSMMDRLAVAIVFISVPPSAHKCFSANLFCLVSYMFPK